jgi:hypothetical protein
MVPAAKINAPSGSNDARKRIVSLGACEIAFAPQYCLWPRTLVKPTIRDDHRKTIIK